MSFSTPVLFIVFNRINQTQQVFRILKLIKPKYLYISADGPRLNNKNDFEQTNLVRDHIINNINWDCDLKTLFHEKNQGCKKSVSSAINWFFKHEEMGIILEDDCVPSLSFFSFCECLLLKYKEDLRIWHISGANFQNNIIRGDGDYFFSRFNHVWGWATWRSRWTHFDLTMKSFKTFQSENAISNIFESKRVQRYWLALLKSAHEDRIDTWDFQWTYTIWINSGLSIIPNKNLITNIGFGSEAVHSVNENQRMSNLSNLEISFPLQHPKFLLIDLAADFYSLKRIYVKGNIMKALMKIKSFFYGNRM